MMTRRIAGAVLLCLLGAAVGCRHEPVAPVLSDSRIYSNPQEGLRILIPDGWSQVSNSNLPPGPLSHEIFLVRYNLNTPEMGASFQIIAMDDKAALDLEAHHCEGSFRIAAWQVQEPRKAVTIQGVPAEQMTYSAPSDGKVTIKKVTSFRRNGRVYSAIGVYWATDDKARQQIDRATQDITWSS